ncbi:MAG: hypothetical protein IJI57_14860 [Flexilinea sp.]|nr:hypothetical protein [Flexilinea sp.]
MQKPDAGLTVGSLLPTILSHAFFGQRFVNDLPKHDETFLLLRRQPAQQGRIWLCALQHAARDTALVCGLRRSTRAVSVCSVPDQDKSFLCIKYLIFTMYEKSFKDENYITPSEMVLLCLLTPCPGLRGTP